MNWLRWKEKIRIKLVLLSGICIGIVLLQGCNFHSNSHLDFKEKFKPIKHPIVMYIMKDIEINARRYDYAQFMTKSQVKRLSEGRVKGFAIIGKDTCTIYVQPPNTVDQVEIILHEIMHCQDKKFHE